MAWEKTMRMGTKMAPVPGVKGTALRLGSLRILIAAAEAEAAFGQIFADGDFFLKAAVSNAGEDAGFDAGAVAARNHALMRHGARDESARFLAATAPASKARVLACIRHRGFQEEIAVCEICPKAASASAAAISIPKAPESKLAVPFTPAPAPFSSPSASSSPKPSHRRPLSPRRRLHQASLDI